MTCSTWPKTWQSVLSNNVFSQPCAHHKQPGFLCQSKVHILSYQIAILKDNCPSWLMWHAVCEVISKSEKISLRLVDITSTMYWCMETWWIAWQCNPYNPHNPCNPCEISQGLHGISWYGMVLFTFAYPYNIVWIMSEHCHNCLSMQSGGILLHFCWWWLFYLASKHCTYPNLLIVPLALIPVSLLFVFLPLLCVCLWESSLESIVLHLDIGDVLILISVMLLSLHNGSFNANKISPR